MLNELVTKFKKNIPYIYSIIFVVFILYVLISHKTAEKEILKYKFKGVVERVVYDDKSTPIVTINSRTYYLGSTSWDFRRLISDGDSLKKDSNNMTVELIKKTSKKVILFDNK